jgi:hypothetical protein
MTHTFESPADLELAHYGVKGMRWGVRKDRERVYRERAKNSKSKASDFEKASKDFRKSARTTNANSPKKRRLDERADSIADSQAKKHRKAEAKNTKRADTEAFWKKDASSETVKGLKAERERIKSGMVKRAILYTAVPVATNALGFTPAQTLAVTGMVGFTDTLLNSNKTKIALKDLPTKGQEKREYKRAGRQALGGVYGGAVGTAIVGGFELKANTKRIHMAELREAERKWKQHYG